MKLRKTVVEGEAVSWGYGHAWRDFMRRNTVCYPIPLNLILHYLRRLWHWSLLSFWMKHSAIDKIYQVGLITGRKDQAELEAAIWEKEKEIWIQEGREQVVQAIEAEIDKKEPND